jgi:hypothetical protein
LNVTVVITASVPQLHHSPTATECLAGAGHRLDPEKMVARSAGDDTAAAREVGREHRADRAAPRGIAEHGAEIDRLEGEDLAFLGQRLLDACESRAGAGAHDEFSRLVEPDASERGGGDGDRLVDRPPHRTLGAAADDLERAARVCCIRDEALKLTLAFRTEMLLRARH